MSISPSGNIVGVGKALHEFFRDRTDHLIAYCKSGCKVITLLPSPYTVKVYGKLCSTFFSGHSIA
jgi:hypothetical protein